MTKWETDRKDRRKRHGGGEKARVGAERGKERRIKKEWQQWRSSSFEPGRSGEAIREIRKEKKRSWAVRVGEYRGSRRGRERSRREDERKDANPARLSPSQIYSGVFTGHRAALLRTLL